MSSPLTKRKGEQVRVENETQQYLQREYISIYTYILLSVVGLRKWNTVESNCKRKSKK